MVPLGRYVEQQSRQGPRSPSSERATDQYWEGGPYALRARAFPSTAGSSHQADTCRGEPGRDGPVLEDTAEAAWVPYDPDQYRVRCRHRRSHEGSSVADGILRDHPVPLVVGEASRTQLSPAFLHE